MSVQDKEGVETSALKPVGLGSREEAVLHGIPSHGRKCRGAAPLKKKRRRASGRPKYLSALHVDGSTHWVPWVGT